MMASGITVTTMALERYYLSQETSIVVISKLACTMVKENSPMLKVVAMREDS